jgi:hypothetical protein
MTREERNTLGALAGWLKCTRCKGFVEPWPWLRQQDDIVHTMHATCWMAWDLRDMGHYVDDVNDTVLSQIMEDL